MNWNEYLKSEFDERKRRNPGYSLRSFSKAIGISPTHLSLILAGQRQVKAKSALRLAGSLGLSPSEALLFLGNGGSAKHDKNGKKKTRLLETSEFEPICEWYHFAILGLADFRFNVADPDWIAKKLNLSPVLAKKAFDTLVSRGLIEIKHHQFRQCTDPLRTEDDVPAEAGRRFHRQVLQLAGEKLGTVPIDLREFSAMTIAINPKRMAAAKKLIRNFKEKFTDEVSRGEMSAVYQLCIQFYPLTQTQENRNERRKRNE